jgi:hypothetical protein
MPTKGDTNIDRGRWARSPLPIVLSLVVIAMLLISVHVFVGQDGGPSPSDHDDRPKYSGEPRDYYQTGPGPECIIGCSGGLVSEDLDNLDLSGYEELPIYVMRPPELRNERDALDYLAKMNFTVTDYWYDLWDSPRFGHYFQGRDLDVKVLLNGAISVSFHSLVIPMWQPNITVEEAISLSKGFMENHTGVPDDAEMEVSMSKGINASGETCITNFYIHFYRRVDGRVMTNSGVLTNHIMIDVDAYRGRVRSFDYAWTDLEVIDVLSGDDLEELRTVVGGYVEWHNQRWAATFPEDSPRMNISAVSIEYCPPAGSSPDDMYEGSPSYVLLPVVRIELGGGYVYMSPLTEIEEE